MLLASFVEKAVYELRYELNNGRLARFRGSVLALRELFGEP